MTRDKYYDLSKSERVDIPFMTSSEVFKKYDKGWRYSFVYSFTEIRDLFLEILNPLINFGLINKAYEITFWNN